MKSGLFFTGVLFSLEDGRWFCHILVFKVSTLHLSSYKLRLIPVKMNLSLFIILTARCVATSVLTSMSDAVV